MRQKTVRHVLTAEREPPEPQVQTPPFPLERAEQGQALRVLTAEAAVLTHRAEVR